MHRSTDSVRIVIYDTADPDYFLTLTEVDDPDNWKLPGGKFELGETPDQAANRELEEEVGILGKEVGLQQVAQLVNDDGVSAHYIFRAVASRNDIKLSAEIARIAWHTKATLPGGKNQAHMLSAVEATTS